jgi:hypothetical protein
MNRRLTPGNASLLLLLTSAIAACGASGTVLESTDGGGDSGSNVTPGSGDASADGAIADGTDERYVNACLTADGDGGCCPGYLPDNDGGCYSASIRRPFLVGSSMRSAVARPRGDWSLALEPLAHRPDEATARLLAATWLKDALEEHASIAAFARFSMLLLSVSAPPDLVMRSQRASLDEIRHARACFALAERHGGVAQGPSSLVVHDAMGEMSLADIAALTAEEGCVGETLGAALAAEQLAVTTDPATIGILRRIAADEARHAELAWRFVKWAAMTGGEEVERAIVRGVERAVAGTLAAELRTYDGIDLDVLHAHGKLTCHEARAVVLRTIEEVVRPCLAAVLRREAASASSTTAPQGRVGSATLAAREA